LGELLLLALGIAEEETILIKPIGLKMFFDAFRLIWANLLLDWLSS